MREQTTEQPHTYFLIRCVERIKFRFFVIILNRDVATLVEQGH